LSVLSGGERTPPRRSSSSLVIQPDPAACFDEPTNHVDWGRACEWLAGSISRRYPGAPLWIVSHDRFFLDEVAEEIIESWNAARRAYLRRELHGLQHEEGSRAARLALEDLPAAARGDRATTGGDPAIFSAATVSFRFDAQPRKRQPR